MYDTSERFVRDVNAMIATINALPRTLAKPVLKSSLNRFGREYVRSVQESIRGENGDKDTLHRRTGALARAFNHTTVNTGNDCSLFIWVDNTVKKYWKTHETGATINAGPGKALAIPVGPALTRAGVPRYTSPRQVQGLVLIPRYNKAPVLGRFEGDKLMVYFVLKKSVTIPARLGLKEKWKTQLVDIVPIMKNEFDKVVIGLKRNG